MPTKVELRLRVIRAAGLKRLRVLDLCAGAGHVWQAMREHVEVEAYTPVDREPRLLGTIHGDVKDRQFVHSLRPETYNVIDVDTYGEPWEPWSYCAERLTSKTAVFLTHGLSGAGPSLSRFTWAALGLPREWPLMHKRELAIFSERYCLAASAGRARLALVLRSRPSGRVNYLGLIAEPATRGASRRRA